MVLFAVLLPLILFIAVLSVDIGNWWTHKRRLQTQVDAAALAAAPLFVKCFNDSSTADELIASEALKYAGDFHANRDPANPGPMTSLNQQVQEPGDVYIVLNSPRFWQQSDGSDPTSPTQGYGLDWTADGDPSTPALDPSDPCSARFLDVKATDDEVMPLWGRIKNWRDFPAVASPKARARVEAHPLQGLSGFLPWAVPEANPKTVAALFVDETDSTGVVRTFARLTGPTDPSDTETLNGEAASVWDGLASVDMVNQNGMIVMTSRQVLQDSDFAGKTLAQICSMPTAACYGGETNQSGVEFVRGTPASDGPGGQVVLSTVELTTLPPPSGPGFNPPPGLTPCSTTDPDSSPYFLYHADCHLRIRAQVEFGSLPSPRAVKVNGNANCTSGIDLQLRDGWWESNWLPRIDPESRRNGFTLCWRAGNGGSAPSGDWGGQTMQMTYAADPGTAGSGPMVYSAIRTASSGCTLYASALNITSQTVCVQVGLQPPLRLGQADDPPIFLRTAESSLNQMLDCDHSPRGTEEEIRDGCATPHQVNTRGLVCDPPYDQSVLPLNLPPGEEPNPWPDCIEANTGSVTDMSKGLRARFEDGEDAVPPGAGCSLNLWDEYRDAGVVPPPEDPRRVTLVVAEYATFDDTGTTVLPITKFAGFYVTGWFTKTGSQMAQGCPDNDPPPTPPFCSGGPCDPGDTKVQGAVWGYYITDVKLEGRPDEDEFCDFTDVRTCVAQLVE
jgi:hypothetical protein